MKCREYLKYSLVWVEYGSTFCLIKIKTVVYSQVQNITKVFVIFINASTDCHGWYSGLDWEIKVKEHIYGRDQYKGDEEGGDGFVTDNHNQRMTQLGKQLHKWLYGSCLMINILVSVHGRRHHYRLCSSTLFVICIYFYNTDCNFSV